MKEKVESVFQMKFKGSNEELHKVILQARAFLKIQQVEEEKINRVVLAIDELAANVIMHNKDSMDKTIEVKIGVREELVLTILDDGKAFDSSAFEPVVNYEAQGGLGLFLIKNMARSFEYSFDTGRNRIELTY